MFSAQLYTVNREKRERERKMENGRQTDRKREIAGGAIENEEQNRQNMLRKRICRLFLENIKWVPLYQCDSKYRVLCYTVTLYEYGTKGMAVNMSSILIWNFLICEGCRRYEKALG